VIDLFLLRDRASCAYVGALVGFVIQTVLVGVGGLLRSHGNVVAEHVLGVAFWPVAVRYHTGDICGIYRMAPLLDWMLWLVAVEIAWIGPGALLGAAAWDLETWPKSR